MVEWCGRFFARLFVILKFWERSIYCPAGLIWPVQLLIIISMLGFFCCRSICFCVCTLECDCVRHHNFSFLYFCSRSCCSGRILLFNNTLVVEYDWTFIIEFFAIKSVKNGVLVCPLLYHLRVMVLSFSKFNQNFIYNLQVWKKFEVGGNLSRFPNYMF